jgi:type II secretory pathway component PulJ
MLRRQQGFGIPELLVGIAVGMIIVAAAVQMLFTTLRNSNDNIKMARLEQDLRQTMQMVTRDLRRATTWDTTMDVARVALAAPLTLSANTGDVTVSSSATNFSTVGDRAEGGTLIHVDSAGTVYKGTITAYSSPSYSVTLTGTWPASVITTNGISQGSWNILRPEPGITVSGTCVLFVYDFDTDDDGDYDVGRYGYRYDSTDDAVEIRTAGASTDTCASGGTWQNLTDDNVVEITAFTVTDNSPAAISSLGLSVTVREYQISITGRLKADPTVTRTLQETIRVRNDGLT